MTQAIRSMELEDIPQVSAIEREAFPPPWPPTNFRRELVVNTLTSYLVAYDEPEVPTAPREVLDTDCNPGGSGVHFERLRSGLTRLFRGEATGESLQQRILGFAGLWFMADEAHLANIAVRRSLRRRGIGESLLISSIDLALGRNARFITLEVRRSNQAAQALYTKYGFVEVGVRRAYYTDNKEDAVLMTADRIASPSYQDRFQVLRQSHALRWDVEVCGPQE